MSATQKIATIDKLGIIAGGGTLPVALLSYCNEHNIKPYVIAIKGQTPQSTIESCSDYLWVELGQAQKIINFFKRNDVKNLVLIGNVKRPSFKNIRPDFKAIKILSKLKGRAQGDNTVLEIIRDTLSDEGFTVRGFHEFMNNYLAPQGTIGNIEPNHEELETIALGLEAAQRLGQLDIGQSVIVQESTVLAVEAAEGTDALIKRTQGLIRASKSKAILVKSCKPQQDENLDMPTIGIKTILNASKHNIGGIAIQSDKVIIAEPQKVAEAANKCNIFLYGI